ncbi:homoserine kinase [Bacillus tuaregi]|uniref:homoserine kinase n=1 Tax=Bacillus tuaregi TaxID=1816695 RepID=UPI0008F92BB1|nr:homoserine kinase [Bacillus tuaregi]
MNESDMLIIKVPASTANLGPGFDSIGMALNLYLTLEVEKAEKWEVVPLSKEMASFPKDESNFIIQIAMKTAARYNRELTPAKIGVKSEIPLARGLGSSASAIVAGIELADVLGDLNLTRQEKFVIASEIEGHPDNAGASVFGGLIIACQTAESIDEVVTHEVDFEIVAVVPRTELLTKEARGVLPEEVAFKEAVTAGAVSNVLVAALFSGNYDLVGRMMEKDRYHQPYRRKLVPHMAIIEEHAPKYGAFGVALSGAGPTILCLTKPGAAQTVIEGLQKVLPDMDYLSLQVDQSGSKVYSMTGI